MLPKSAAMAGFERACDYAVTAVTNPSARFHMNVLMDALAGLARTARVQAQLGSLILGFISSGPQDQMLMNAYAVALRSIDWEVIGEVDKEEWRRWLAGAPATAEYDSVRLALSAAIREPQNSAERGVSLTEIAAELNATVRFPDVNISQVRVAEMSEALIRDMEEIRHNAAKGMSGFGGLSSPELAAMLVLECPNEPLWQSIAEFLRDRKVARDLKIPALERFAADPEKVDAQFVKTMQSQYDELTKSAPMRLSNDSDDSIFADAVTFAAAIGIVPPERTLSDVSLLASDPAPRTRVEAAKALRGVARRSGLTPLWSVALLVQLCRDRDATVRAHAGQGLALANVDGLGMTRLQNQVLDELLRDPGVLVPLLVVQGLDLRWHDDSARSSDLLRAVQRTGEESLSHLVRSAADHALQTARVK
ncbi:hypothetical protein [Phycicoccus jejuensis]|uniref:hypothetical protein n=1 Tax=Phycicoccus jejuensis TaxID=367299 RepID=UPI0012F9E964|nr:hypothetical protein [Phycicoccus jejuensis]